MMALTSLPSLPCQSTAGVLHAFYNHPHPLIPSINLPSLLVVVELELNGQDMMEGDIDIEW